MVPSVLADKLLQRLTILIVMISNRFDILVFDLRDQAGDVLLRQRALLLTHQASRIWFHKPLQPFQHSLQLLGTNHRVP